MTDPYRVLFREGRLNPPEGFDKVLTAQVPAYVAVEDRVVISSTSDPRKVSFHSHFELSEDVVLAVQNMIVKTHTFPLSPNVDVFERIVTPGAGGITSKLLDEANIIESKKRRLSEKALEDQIIPTHEVQGHIEPNLNPDKCFWEPQLIWQFLIECVRSPTRDVFLDWGDQWNDDVLTQSCIVKFELPPRVE